MTYEEAIAMIQNDKKIHHDYLSGKYRKALTMAIEALEKQIPKKPIHKHKNYYCPICKEDGWVLWDDAEPNDFDNFCGKCGQALDWSGEE